MTTVIILALAGSVIAAIVGTLWYSGSTPMGRIHMKSLGFDTLSTDEQKQRMEAGKAMMPKLYVAQLILSFLTAFETVFIIYMSVKNGLNVFMATAFVVFNWLCFMVPIIGSSILWSNCDRSIAWKKFFSDASANLVTLLVTAFFASLFV